MPKIDISSSDIKERICAGRSIRYLVPDKVEEWIREEGLYRSLV
jgi:nicotinate-nucleotide adenylyltransferase